MDDAQGQDAPFAAGRDIVLQQRAQLFGMKGVQVQHPVDRKRNGLIERGVFGGHVGLAFIEMAVSVGTFPFDNDTTLMILVMRLRRGGYRVYAATIATALQAVDAASAVTPTKGH